LPKYLPADKVYLTGNNKTLGNWDPSAVKMDKQSDSVWTKSILFEEGDKLEFKITMGSFKSEAANADGWIFDNIKLTVKRDTTIIIKVDNWKNNYNALPKRWRMYLGVFLAIIIAGFFNIQPKITSTLIYVFFAFTLIEGIFAIFSKRTVNNKGNWLIFSGFVVMNIFIILQLLIDFSFIDNFFGTNQIYVFGMLGLVISISLYLSYNFAYINIDLESQLNKVKVLSEKAIEQEHIAAGLEIERRLIEAENLRKTNELNSARDLQLSLLPKQVPLLDNLDIACFMQTATEVGGDYYDFHVSEDNTITAVIGDATGHGLKAGNMVILAKGLFNTLANESDLLHIMNTFNRAIKQMNLHMLTMCMSLIRIKGNNIEYSSAGMPPLHIYRKSTGKIEQLLLKGMPLGAFYDFPYNKISTDIYKGDVILIMSDGLTELFNAQKETYGMEKVIVSFRTSADKTRRRNN